MPIKLFAKTWHLSVILSKYNSQEFQRLFHLTFPNPKFLKYTPLGTNFSKSAYFNSLRYSHDLITKTITNTNDGNTFLRETQSSLTYPYSSNIVVVFTSISKNYLYDLLYRFLRLSLSVWFQWPRTYKTKVHHTFVTKNFWTIYFLNYYYYKTYNL